MNVTYNARDVAEFKELCFWMRDNGFTKGGAASVATPTRDKGAFEAQYLELSQEKRMRLTNEESGLMAMGKTREDIAQLRLAALNPPPVAADEDIL